DRSGAERWAYAIPAFASVSASPVIGPSGAIYVGDSSGNVASLMPTGGPAWVSHAQEPRPISALAAADAATIYAAQANVLHAIRPNGSAAWSYSLPSTWERFGGVVTGPDGTVYGFTDAALYAVNPDGSARFKYPADGGCSPMSAPAIGSDGAIYLPCGS